MLWRSGSQVAAQGVQWPSTFLVIRLLDPADDGLSAGTQVVPVFLNMLNGDGLAGALVREPAVTERQERQGMGLLILLNGALAAAQLLLAPVAAGYYRQPMVADLLRVQPLLDLATPFVALPVALLSRRVAYRGRRPRTWRRRSRARRPRSPARWPAGA